MKNKKILKVIFFILASLITSSASAGFFSLTFFSRANCANNESITWDATATWQLLVYSNQFNVETGENKFFMVEQANANRAAAVCWGCGLGGGWVVEGSHFISTPSSAGSSREVGEKLQDDCTGYIFTGDHQFFMPCQSTYADSCNFTDW